MSEPDFAAMAKKWCPIAAQILSWRPADFWAATPAELALALSEPGAGGGASAPSRELIEHMMERDAHG